VQALKAGVMEIPDIIVVNKRDHPMIDLAVRELRQVLALVPPRGGWRVPVLMTEASHGGGVGELDEALRAHLQHLRETGELETRRRRKSRYAVIAMASASWRRNLESRLEGDAAFDALLDEVADLRLDPASAARRLGGP
jgi:LAO/AO transport system kinase